MPAPPGVRPRSTEFPEEHAHIVELNWSTHYIQLKPGTFQGSLFDAECGGVTVGLETYNLPMEEMFCAPPDAFFYVRARTSGEAFCEGRGLDCNFAMVCTDEALLHFLVRGQYEGSYVAVKGALIDALLPDFDWRSHLRKSRVCLVDEAHARQLDTVVGRFLDGVASGSSAAHMAGLAEDLAIGSAALMAGSGRQLGRVPASHTRTYVFRKAREFILDQLDQDITVSDLCRALRVSERTLEYCFKDVVALGPKRYILTHRLNRVRSDIVRERGLRSLTELAYKWGFTHPSRFAQQYRRQFLELPSDTQRKVRDPSI